MRTPITAYTSVHGGQIAYQVIGDGDQDILYLRSFGNVETQWDVPPIAHFLHGLSTLGRLIVFDRRGSGASDPVPLDGMPTWEEWAEDIVSVLDDVGATRTILVGEIDAGPIALIFAASHPDRVDALVLMTTTAKYIKSDDFPIGIPDEIISSFVELFMRSWGTPELASLVIPSMADDADFIDRFTRFVRSAATPRTASIQYNYMFRSNDTRAALPLIQAPTLILHRSDSPFVPVEMGRYMEERIADSKFIEIPGQDVFFFGEGADQVLDEIAEFVGDERRFEDADRILTTILFTDIVSSTQRAASLGDQRWRGLLDSHDRVVREQLARFRGTAINTTGDGFLASFDGPARALRCANSIVGAVNGLGVDIRVGVHTGECERRGNDLGGLAVHIASRVGALAETGEVLVTRTVKDLVAGSGIAFIDRGIRVLKGVPDEWHLYAVGSA